MNPFLRKLLGPYLDDADAGDEGAAAGDVAAPEPQQTPAPAPDAPIDEAAMADEIFAKLKSEETTMVRDVKTGKFVERSALDTEKTPAKPVGEKQPPAKAVEIPPDKAVADKAKTDAEALKAKKADDFQLSPEEKKVLGQKAQQRFHELTSFAKLREQEAAAVATENKALREARDNIVSVLDEHKTNADELQQLLTYNLAIKSGRLDEALAMVEEQRNAIYRAMGKEAPGVDLLSEFPDLSEKVAAMELNRESALEVAKARRVAAANEQRSRGEQQQTQAAQQNERRQTSALDAIKAWDTKLRGEDIDYDQKLSKLTPKIEVVLQKYPPELWLETLQGFYDSIEVVKAPNPGSNGMKPPLRPTGAKGGDKAPANMEDAISLGLGLHH